MKPRVWLIPALAVLLVVTLGHVPSAVAERGVTFALTAKSAYLRSEPSLNAARTYSVFRGQHFAVTGRSADNGWLRLDVPGASQGTWALASYGEVRGDVNRVPVVTAGGEVVRDVSSTPEAASPTEVPVPAVTSAPEEPTGSTLSLKFTITARSVFARTAPGWTAARSGSLFKGQSFTVVGRNADAQWFQIRNGNRLAWVPAGVGSLIGNAGMLPVTDNVAPNPDGSAWVPIITPFMRQIYERSPEYGRSLDRLAVVGDCNSEWPVYLERVAAGRFDLRGRLDLQATVAYFSPSIRRQSLAVYGGFSTGSVLDPDWGHTTYCRFDEGPFACELRVSQASIVFIALGTGDQYAWRDVEAHYRAMIEYALENGVLPVLVTKADALESQVGGAEPDYINTVVRRLAQEYQVPLVDFWLATRALPDDGLRDSFHLDETGINLHILLTLQTLDAIWRH